MGIHCKSKRINTYKAKGIEGIFVKFDSIPHKSFLRGVFYSEVELYKNS